METIVTKVPLSPHVLGPRKRHETKPSSPRPAEVGYKTFITAAMSSLYCGTADNKDHDETLAADYQLSNPFVSLFAGCLEMPVL